MRPWGIQGTLWQIPMVQGSQRCDATLKHRLEHIRVVAHDGFAVPISELHDDLAMNARTSAGARETLGLQDKTFSSSALTSPWVVKNADGAREALQSLRQDCSSGNCPGQSPSQTL